MRLTTDTCGRRHGLVRTAVWAAKTASVGSRSPSSFFPFMCMHVCLSVCLHVNVCGDQRSTCGICLNCSPHYYLEESFSLHLGQQWARMTDQGHLVYSCLCLHSSGITDIYHSAWFLVLGLQMCATLPDFLHGCQGSTLRASCLQDISPALSRTLFLRC